MEIPNVDINNGSTRKLSALFSTIESVKASLFFHDYALSQTTLEQIFNTFAAGQEEERGQISQLQSNRPEATKAHDIELTKVS